MKDRKQAALDYHAQPMPGKIAVVPTKPCETQQDLSLAYTPGVAEPVREIAKDPAAAYRYTNKGNLVAVISDGSAILGLGNRGALAAKPVLEGKAVLFKRFANIDVFDIEIEAPDRDSFINTVANIAPTFGGINLEDIAAPECFLIEEMLRARLDIPVFHDDQHATAVIVCAGLLNALELQGKNLPEARIVLQGAGAAGLATMKLLIELGAKRELMVLLDRQGVVHPGRPDLNIYKRRYAQVTDKRTLSDSMQDADAFIGVSAPNMVSPEMVASMAPKPVVFALANPDPEISPELAKGVRTDLIMATGRSDYPNQVNNVLVFPYVFRGALDVHASSISRPMLVGAVRALATLAHEPVPAEVLRAYGLDQLEYGPNYIIPKPLDSRLMKIVPPAVARAAVDSGVARAGYPAHYPNP
ncbi:MAG TPA: malic enzyme-like NAD(P)-binding protein [Sulfuricaulis sp.]|nr:malic enzyme-like NAD(P)-binding protein [Sulfuricaulis sp.]